MKVHEFRCTASTMGATLCVAIGAWLALTGMSQAQDAGRKEIMTLVKKKIGRVKDLDINPFFGDFSGDGRDDALVISYYANRGGGNSFEIAVMLFEGSNAGFRFVRGVGNVYGESPRDAKFKRGQIKITLTTLGPDDPRCCPTLSKEYTIATP